MPIQLTDFFEDPAVTDVAVNAFDRLSFKREGLWLSGSSPFSGASEFTEWLVNLVESADGRLDFAHPAASVTSGGYRVHALIGGQVAPNSSATFRRLKPSSERLDYVDAKSFERLSFLNEAVRARQNILIAGPAGAGKTSLLRELLVGVGEDRVITIEDIAELNLNLPNSISLISREANVEGSGAITLENLLTEALRMSPDRLAVGEIRGPELLVILNALNTGHTGAGATIHANSLKAVSSRMEAIAALGGIRSQALARLAVAAFDLVVFVENRRGHRIAGIGRFLLDGKKLMVEALDV